MDSETLLFLMGWIIGVLTMFVYGLSDRKSK
jgi:hypothetical protein